MNRREIANEYKLIFLCARFDVNDYIQQEIKELLSASIDWNKIIEVCTYQQILPFLYYNLSKINLQHMLPEDAFLIMENYYYSNLNRNVILEKEIFAILKLTNRSGVNVIPFRGFNLIQTLYNNPALRIMNDIDILIKRNGFQKTRDILVQLGYEENTEDNFTQNQQKYNFVFSKKLSLNISLVIEPHYSLAPARPYQINLPYLWERAQIKTIKGQKLSCLSEEDTFLSLALHLRRHTLRLLLKFIVDIAELLNANQNTLDWAYIEKSAKENRIITPIYLSLYLSKDLLKTPISPKIFNAFRPDITNRALIHFTINRYNFFTLKKWQGRFLRFLLFDSILDFLFYLWRVSFLERFIAKQRFKKTPKSTAKKIPTDAKEITKK